MPSIDRKGYGARARTTRTSNLLPSSRATARPLEPLTNNPISTNYLAPAADPRFGSVLQPWPCTSCPF